MTTAVSSFDLSQKAPPIQRTPSATTVKPKTRPVVAVMPNTLVRWAFMLSVFAIPFTNLYLPGTGGELGVLRIVQLIMVCAVLSQPHVCLRWFPKALLWFLAYITMRIGWGIWLTPDLADSWWPSCRLFIQILPWVWVMFNVLHYPGMWQQGLWALGSGCFCCALFHIAGIGVEQVPGELEGRTSIFGVNANELGNTYAISMVALLGLWLVGKKTWLQRSLPFFMMTVIGIGLAKSGSRESGLILALGVCILFLFGHAISSKAKRFGGALIIVVMLGFTLWQIPTMLTRFNEFHPQTASTQDPRTRMAIVLWEMVQRNPLLGTGPDGYEAELTRQAMPYMVNQGKTITAHNQVLLLLVETGVIGFLIFSAGLAKALVTAWRARNKTPVPLALVFPFVVAAATVTHPNGFLIFWVVVAYGLAGTAMKDAVKRAELSTPRPQG